MTPLTPEQVEELRLPAWFELVPTREVVKNTIPECMLCRCEPWAGQTKDDSGDAFHAPKSEIALAQIAEHCANGHLPPEVLDYAWRMVEGRKTDEEVVLGWLAESSNRTLRIVSGWVMLTDRGVVDFPDMASARTWIEEQGR